MPDNVLKLTWEDVEKAVDVIVQQKNGGRKYGTVVAIARGGLVPARMLAARLGIQNIAVWDKNCGILGYLHPPLLLVDDILDTGKTHNRALELFQNPHFAVIVSKGQHGATAGILLPHDDGRWVVFPWEGEEDKAGTRQSEWCGND